MILSLYFLGGFDLHTCHVLNLKMSNLACRMYDIQFTDWCNICMESNALIG